MGYQIEKAGIIGYGITTKDAKDDWAVKFAEMIRYPKVSE